jgi:hypothetical protein
MTHWLFQPLGPDNDFKDKKPSAAILSIQIRHRGNFDRFEDFTSNLMI